MTPTRPLMPAAARAAGKARRRPRDGSENGGQTGRHVLAIIAMFAVGLVVVVWRRPDAVTYPQFWAEDGRNWFGDAYNNGGLASLFVVQGGYLQTLPRLVAIPAAHLTIVNAALLFNLVGISIQAAPAAFFMSRRFEHVASHPWVRGMVAAIYLLIPSFELNATITNAQWHLFILAVMVLVARRPARAWNHAFDVVVLMLSALTGPFALILLPAAIVRVVVSRADRRWYSALSGVLVLASALQVWAATHSPGRHITAPLGASLKDLVFMVADRIVLAGSFGEEGHTYLFTQGHAHGLLIAGVLTIVAIAVVSFVLLRSGWPLRVFVLACFGLTAVAMLSPAASVGSAPSWAVMATSNAAERYFLSAELAWLLCVVWLVSHISVRGVRYGLAAVFSVMFASGIVRYTQYPPYIDFHPAAYDAQLRTAAPKTTVNVPINPDWNMPLTTPNGSR